jgi:hypothetical protein
MSKPIVLSEASWLKIYNHIARTYPPSVFLIRDKMRKVLGFTSRTHEEWVEYDQSLNRRNDGFTAKYCVISIHLDFYNEPKRTMFLLKYSEYLDKSGNSTLDIE